MDIEEGTIVLCTVTKIVGTTIFLRLDDYNLEGTMITSEVAPGRIRNLRDYVVPNKKIVCKILRMSNNRIDLSLRRVTTKEKREVIDSHSKEKSLESAIKNIVKNPEELIQKIRAESTLSEFFEKIKQTPDLLQKFADKEEAEKLLKILEEKKEKDVVVKKKFSLSSEADDGIVRIKRILPKEAVYLAAGKYVLQIKDKNYKEANIKVVRIINELELKAKKEGCAFSYEK